MTEHRNPLVRLPDWTRDDQFELMRLSSPIGDVIASCHFRWLRRAPVMLALGGAIIVMSPVIAATTQNGVMAFGTLALGVIVMLVTFHVMVQGAGPGLARPAFIRAAIQYATPEAARQLVEQLAQLMVRRRKIGLTQLDVITAYRDASRSVSTQRPRRVDPVHRIAAAQHVTISLFRSVG